MNIKRFFGIIACMALFVGGSSLAVQAQEQGRDESRGHFNRDFKPIRYSPEEKALRITNQMDSMLHLTEKQYKKIYKLNLKWARNDSKSKSSHSSMGGHPGGGRPGGPGGGGMMGGPGGGGMMGGPGGGGMMGGPGGGPGDMPRQGFEGGRPPHDAQPVTPEDMEKQRQKMEKEQAKRDKKIKKILTDEQYNLWIEKRAPENPQPNPQPDFGGR